ncbi:ElaD/SseL family deubiquitinase [Erwinia sp. ErVv1]|uniref:ElaD/SseL family deubiquitinase n=1 Tax=Erwinia sp. ErVv1 TaxID=1603299 RepID=UPI000836EA0C|nr:ElaD/SseL family deubiquitinase [Erwinia sp. ErVv1]
MIIDFYSRYQINLEQFDNLFTDDVDIKTLDVLGQSAADGNVDCIDILHNISLRNDEAGKRSEDILFGLFSGKTEGKKGIDEEIQLASLKLYETACKTKETNDPDRSKFNSPSKLLYMAGSALTHATQKQDVTAIFSGGNRSQSPYEQFVDQDLWSRARMLTTDEINAAMYDVNQDADNLSLNFPIGLIEPEKNINMLSEQIGEKIKSNNISDKAEVFPINSGDHWVMFALYKDGSDHINKCVVFNSLGDLNENAKNNLIDSARAAGVPKENIAFINGDMQENVPNGCGVFVVKAIEALSKSPEKTPVDTLKEFVGDFAKLSAEDQTTFNIQTRRQLYEYSIL